MKLEVIGANSAFAKEGGNSSLLLHLNDGSAVLLDCGYNIFPRLLEKDLTQKIKTVLLSHTHQDHCGSAITLLEYRLAAYGETTAIGGVSWQKLLDLCEGSDSGRLIRLPDIKLEMLDVPHAKGMECKAMLVEDKVFYSGDSAVSLLNTETAQKAQFIVHDAALSANPNHASIKELATAPCDVKARTYLTHYLPEKYEEISRLAEKYGFGGVLKSGDIFGIS